MTAKRRICDGCGRPASVCLCPALTRLTAAVELIIWQDPLEAKHPLSTAPLLQRSVINSQLLIAEQLSFDDVFGDTPADEIAVLFPFTHTGQVAADQRPLIRKLLVLDGTWRKVRKIILANRWLSDMPYINLQVTKPGRYGIRTSPREDGVSTLEAAVLALNDLEQTDKYNAVLPVLDRLVALQKGFGHKQAPDR